MHAAPMAMRDAWAAELLEPSREREGVGMAGSSFCLWPSSLSRAERAEREGVSMARSS